MNLTDKKFKSFRTNYSLSEFETEEFKEEIRVFCEQNPLSFFNHFQTDRHLEFAFYIHEHYEGGNISQKIYNYLNGLNETPKCLNCETERRTYINFPFGYNNYCSTKCFGRSEIQKEKRKNTNLKNYGVENSWSKGHPGRKSLERTNLEKYGFINASSNEETKLKIASTNLLKYGNKCSLINEDSQRKSKDSCKSKYGVDHPSKTAEFRSNLSQRMLKQGIEIAEKSRITRLKNYGANHHMQNAEYYEKVQHKMMTPKIYTMPSGKTVFVQGYENNVIDILLNQGYSENDIVLGKREMPQLIFQWDGKDRRYYPDIYLPKKNLIIEVKSTWTYNGIDRGLELLKQKQNCVLRQNLDFMIFLYRDKKWNIITLNEDLTERERILL
jgi:hypothetical protein